MLILFLRQGAMGLVDRWLGFHFHLSGRSHFVSESGSVTIWFTPCIATFDFMINASLLGLASFASKPGSGLRQQNKDWPAGAFWEIQGMSHQQVTAEPKVPNQSSNSQSVWWAIQSWFGILIIFGWVQGSWHHHGSPRLRQGVSSIPVWFSCATYSCSPVVRIFCSQIRYWNHTCFNASTNKGCS